MICFRSFACLPLLRPGGGRYLCHCSATFATAPPDMARYKEAFSRRMSMAGIKPHHRIALGVSGGPDSMALCFLAAGWKLEGLVGKNEVLGFIDGILGIVVDHRLRAESTEEAILVRDRVKKMGIECEIASCEWPEGRPKLGRLQEAAREMRYKIFQDVCSRHQIGVLLIAHHADDQAELFILRLSRSSGVLGLAGMPFVSQLFPPYLTCCPEEPSFAGILLVRPMLDLLKDDMYKICQGGNQEWVEDPTNQNPLFARNRIRISLRNSSYLFASELKTLISACRLTRSYVEHNCQRMIENSVTITEYGYAVIDLEKLKPSNVDDISLSRYAALIMQFISQRHRPVRGSILQLLLEYIRKIPCKTSLTAASCYVSPAPRSKGLKILICYSTDSPQSSKTDFPFKCSSREHSTLPSEIRQIIVDAKLYSDKAVSEASSLNFMDSRLSNDILSEARKINLISESTLNRIFLLKLEEHEKFSANKHISDHQSGNRKNTAASSITIRPGESCHFMNRFIVTWKPPEDANGEESCEDDICKFCMLGLVQSVAIRHMVDADWLYLAGLLKGRVIQECQGHVDVAMHDDIYHSVKQKEKYGYFQLQAWSALKALKSIPVPARRALPVVVDSQGLLLSIPSISFRCCPCLSVVSVFKPLIPLGGGYSSYI